MTTVTQAQLRSSRANHAMDALCCATEPEQKQTIMNSVVVMTFTGGDAANTVHNCGVAQENFHPPRSVRCEPRFKIELKIGILTSLSAVGLKFEFFFKNSQYIFLLGIFFLVLSIYFKLINLSSRSAPVLKICSLIRALRI